MMEPTIWMQLGIPEERHRTVSSEIESILKTRETTGNMMLMVRDSTRMNDDEKYYAVYMIAKQDLARKLIDKMPPMGRGLIASLLKE